MLAENNLRKFPNVAVRLTWILSTKCFGWKTCNYIPKEALNKSSKKYYSEYMEAF